MKGKIEPESMEEIHRIREKIYSETKNMTIHEKLLNISKRAEIFKSKYNLELKILKNENPELAT
ncbi:MAG: hypothetical protein MRK02_08305 [Candidatus Scalindua sp.]|nr:hypothetical protein [Candidatus Scalindua sp.]